MRETSNRTLAPTRQCWAATRSVSVARATAKLWTTLDSSKRVWNHSSAPGTILRWHWTPCLYVAVAKHLQEVMQDCGSSKETIEMMASAMMQHKRSWSRLLADTILPGVIGCCERNGKLSSCLRLQHAREYISQRRFGQHTKCISSPAQPVFNQEKAKVFSCLSFI